MGNWVIGMRERIIVWMKLLAIALLLVLVTIQFWNLRQRYDSVGIWLKDGVTKKYLITCLEKEMKERTCKLSEITAYNQKEGTVKVTGIGTLVTTNFFSVYGDIQDITPMTLIAGNLLVVGDDYGCVLTKDLAYELFQSIDVLGLSIMIGDRTYVVRGIVEARVEGVYFEEVEESANFLNLEMKFSEDNGGYYAKQFCDIYGLGDNTMLEENYLVMTWSNVYWVPMLLLLLCLLHSMFGQIKRCTPSFWIPIGFAILGGFIIIMIGSHALYVSDRWIPTRWSDFSHYKQVISDYTQQWSLLFSEAMVVKGIALRFDLIKTISLLSFLFGMELAILSKLNQKVDLLSFRILSRIALKRKSLDSKDAYLQLETKHKYEQNY